LRLAFEAEFHPLEDAHRAGPDNLRKEILLAAEMAIERFLRGSGARGDDLHRRVGETAFEEDALGDGGDFFAPFLTARDASRFLHICSGQIG